MLRYIFIFILGVLFPFFIAPALILWLAYLSVRGKKKRKGIEIVISGQNPRGCLVEVER